MTAGAPDLILGKPVVTDTNVADPAASAKSVLFGDWSSLVVRLAGGFRFERSDEFAFDADMTTFRAIARHGIGAPGSTARNMPMIAVNTISATTRGFVSSQYAAAPPRARRSPGAGCPGRRCGGARR